MFETHGIGQTPSSLERYLVNEIKMRSTILGNESKYCVSELEWGRKPIEAQSDRCKSHVTGAAMGTKVISVHFFNSTVDMNVI